VTCLLLVVCGLFGYHLYFLLVYMTWVPDILHGTCTCYSLILLHWGQLRLYKLRRWWHEVLGIWYIYESFLLWIILSTYQSHESKVCVCTTSFVHTCIYRSCLCVPVLTTRFSTYAFQLDLSIHVCLLVHATWPHLSYSSGCFLTTPGPACPDAGVWSLWTSFCWSECATVSR